MKTFCKLTAQSPAASYVPLPRFLLQDEALRDISNDAKVLYALLLDRASISRQNGYVEPDGTIRLYFTLEQAQTKLHRSRQSATRIFRELEYSGLIVRRKQGLGKPALITLNYPSDAKLIFLPRFQQFPDLGLLRFQLGNVVLIAAPGAVDAAADLVDVRGGTADGSSQLFLLGVIDLDDVTVDQHFPGVSAEVVRPQLAHFVLDEI